MDVGKVCRKNMFSVGNVGGVLKNEKSSCGAMESKISI